MLLSIIFLQRLSFRFISTKFINVICTQTYWNFPIPLFSNSFHCISIYSFNNCIKCTKTISFSSTYCDAVSKFFAGEKLLFLCTQQNIFYVNIFSILFSYFIHVFLAFQERKVFCSCKGESWCK
jgi:hypothetical protein